MTIQPDKDGPLAVLREALVRPYRDIKEPAFFEIGELPAFVALAQVEALVEAARHMVAVYPDPTSIATNRLYFALAPFMKDTP